MKLKLIMESVLAEQLSTLMEDLDSVKIQQILSLPEPQLSQTLRTLPLIDLKVISMFLLGGREKAWMSSVYDPEDYIDFIKSRMQG